MTDENSIADNRISPYLIPKRPEYGCPVNTFGCDGNDCNRLETCFCEKHCSWGKCRLFDHPSHCLKNIGSGWAWDSKQNFWVAQVGIGMTKIAICNVINSRIKFQ